MRIVALVLALALLPAPAAAFLPAEHAATAAAALERAAMGAGGRLAGTVLVVPVAGGDSLRVDLSRLHPDGFGAAVAAAAADDGDPARYHAPGKTVLEQLAPLRAADLVREEVGGRNVVDAFWRRHHRALARAAAGDLAGALEWEAAAQGYLHDAFASSHLEHPGRAWWRRLLHPVNTKEMHRAHRFTGAWLVDLDGRQWQGFGEGLLDWYPAGREAVVAAATTSLEEVLAQLDPASPLRVLVEVHDGSHYLETLRAPSLRRLPTRAVATWSERLPSPDAHGIRPRRHWIQIRDAHDPSLGADAVNALPAADALPTWARFPRLAQATPAALVAHDPEVASVRFVQRGHVPPSYRGALLLGGAGLSLGARAGEGAWSVGWGWGLVDHLLPTHAIPAVERVSLELRLQGSAEDAATVLSGALSWQLDAAIPGALHLELGYAGAVDGPVARGGPRFAVGLATAGVELPGLYLGGLARLKYEVAFLEDVLGGIFLEFVVH